MNIGTIFVLVVLVAGFGAWLSLVASFVYGIRMLREERDEAEEQR